MSTYTSTSLASLRVIASYMGGGTGTELEHDPYNHHYHHHHPPPLAFSAASPCARWAVETMCATGYANSILSIKIISVGECFDDNNAQTKTTTTTTTTTMINLMREVQFRHRLFADHFNSFSWWLRRGGEFPFRVRQDVRLEPFRAPSGSLFSRVTSVHLSGRQIDLGFLAHCPGLVELQLGACLSLVDLSPLQQHALPQLSALHIRQCGTRSIAFLSSLHCQLQHLSLVDCGQVQGSWCVIGTLHRLLTMDLHGSCVGDLGWIQGCCLLEHIDISECEELADLVPLAGLPRLRTLRADEMGHISDVNWIQGGGVACDELQALHLASTSVESGLAALSHLYLRTLVLRGSFINDVAGIGELAYLEELDLSDCTSLAVADDIGLLDGLRVLDVSGTVIEHVQWVTGCRGMQVLRMARCYEFDGDLAALGDLQNLRAVDMRHCRSVAHIDVLAKCMQLEELDVSGCHALTDLSPLHCLPALRELHVGGTAAQHLQALSDYVPLGDLRKKCGGRCEFLENLAAMAQLPFIGVMDHVGCGDHHEECDDLHVGGDGTLVC